MKRNILHITTVHNRYDVRIHYKYCRSLSLSKDYNINLLVSDGLGDESIEDLFIHDLGVTKWGRLGRFFIGNYKVLSYLRNVKYDILHFHDPELLFIAHYYNLIKRRGVVVFDMHENFPLQILSKEYLNSSLKRVLYKIASWVYKKVLVNMPVIYAEKSYEEDFLYIKKNETIYNFPLSDLTSYSEEMDKLYTIGYMGGVSIERGAITTLNVLYNLRKSGYNVNAIIIGPVSEEVSNSELYKIAKHEGWVVFTGRLKAHEGWRMISKSKMGIAVLKDSPNYVKSYPTKLFEYMLIGLPIITSNFELYKTIVSDNGCGFNIDPNSETEFENSIKYLLDNQEEAVEMGRKGLAVAEEKYSWESQFIKLDKFYRSLLNE